MEKKVEASKLKEGMYVSRLDRPWLETPFLIEGIRIYNSNDLQLLKQHCDYVYIDTDKTVTVKADKERRTDTNRREFSSEDSLALPGPSVIYTDKTSVEEELPVAKELNAELILAVEEIMNDARNGKKISIDNAKTAVTKMKESILRNPNAFMLLRLVKDKDSYTYAHCLHVSTLCVVFGQHLGLPNDTLDDLAIGALLCDIGKARVSSELLTKPGKLTAAESEEMIKHVVHSVAIMDDSGKISHAAIEIAATHHERFDGSGYLRGLHGGQIPVLGRMAAIVDSYDAMTSERLYSQAISPFEAIRRLYGVRNELHQDSLVEHFIQAIGVYPVGAIVELSTGEVGIVISQNKVRRLRPKVMLILDKDKQSLMTAPIIDLITETTDANGEPLEIMKAHEPGVYDIDPKEFFI